LNNNNAWGMAKEYRGEAGESIVSVESITAQVSFLIHSIDQEFGGELLLSVGGKGDGAFRVPVRVHSVELAMSLWVALRQLANVWDGPGRGGAV